MRRIVVFACAILLAASIPAAAQGDEGNLIKIERSSEIQRVIILPLGDDLFELRVLLKVEFTPASVQGGLPITTAHGVYSQFNDYREALDTVRAIRNGDINGFIYSPQKRDASSGGGQGGAKTYLMVKQFLWIP